jgi:hypothetical protein
LGKDPPLAQGVVEHRAGHVAPFLDVRLGDHDDVGRQAQGREHALQAHDLAVVVLDARLDHEQVDVAVGPGLAAGVRAEEDDARAGRGLCDPPRGFVDEVVFDHLARRYRSSAHSSASIASGLSSTSLWV